MTEWRAHISDDFRALATDLRRVVFYRRLGEASEVIIGFDPDGVPTVERHEPGTTIPAGFLVPYEALEALAELLKPGPSQGETARLEETLSVERRRVDDMLAKLRETT